MASAAAMTLATDLVDQLNSTTLKIAYAENNLTIFMARDVPGDMTTLAILSRQGGEMSLTIDDLYQSSCYRGRTSHATPARSHHTGLAAFCTTVFAPRLAPCTGLAPGSDAGPRRTYGDSRLTGDGASGERHFTNYHRVLNRATWSARQAGRILLGLLITCLVPPGSAHYAGSRRHRGTPPRTTDHGQRLLS
jgi:hypothetical protein